MHIIMKWAVSPTWGRGYSARRAEQFIRYLFKALHRRIMTITHPVKLRKSCVLKYRAGVCLRVCARACVEDVERGARGTSSRWSGHCGLRAGQGSSG